MRLSVTSREWDGEGKAPYIAAMLIATRQSFSVNQGYGQKGTWELHPGMHVLRLIGIVTLLCMNDNYMKYEL